MPVYKVNVKWQKEKFTNLECDTDESPVIFKALLFSLTGVPPERQKIMLPGKVLGDDSYSGIKMKDGLNIMLVGSADAIPSAVTTENHEVVPQSEEKVKILCGILNLGNMCYVNSTIQLLYSIPELRRVMEIARISVQGPNGHKSPQTLCLCLQELFNRMGQTDGSVNPMIFISHLHKLCPQFATEEATSTGQSGLALRTFSQQDANECWIEIVRALQRVRIDPVICEKVQNLPSCLQTHTPWNPVDRFFSGELSIQLTCTESKDEPTSENTETFTQLSCFINQEVKYLLTGIRNGFRGTVTKHSSVLGRDAVYQKVTKLTRLPAYLCVQFVRFYYKEDKQINAKVLKDVKFSHSLDMYEFCSNDLQKMLAPMRERFRLEEEADVASTVKLDQDGLRKLESSKTDLTLREKLYDQYWFPDDPGSNNSGYYDLLGVLSHQGRTSTSGHYVSWVKYQGMWLKCDDDRVTQVTSDDILRLSGGGDWHCAYILLYGPRVAKKDVSVNNTDTGASTGSARTTDSTNGGDHS